MYLHAVGEVQSRRNITPNLGSTSVVTSLILIHENMQPCSVNHLDALVNVGSSHVTV